MITKKCLRTTTATVKYLKKTLVYILGYGTKTYTNETVVLISVERMIVLPNLLEMDNKQKIILFY